MQRRARRTSLNPLGSPRWVDIFTSLVMPLHEKAISLDTMARIHHCRPRPRSTREAAQEVRDSRCRNRLGGEFHCIRCNALVGRGRKHMTLSRRNALKFALSATVLGGSTAAIAPAAIPKASADGQTSTPLNVKDYGAIGSGTIDDTAAIHRARDAAGVGVGIVFPAGTYLVDSLDAAVDDQQWTLLDGALIKVRAGSSSFFRVSGDRVSLLGGVVDGSEGPNSADTLEISGVGVSVRHVTVQNSQRYGVAAYNTDKVTVSHCRFFNCRLGAIWVQNNSTGPSHFYDVSITDNYIDNSTGGDKANGIGIRGNSKNQQIHRIEVAGNIVRLPAYQTGLTACIAVTSCTDYIVSRNFCTGGFFGFTCPDSTRASFSHNTVIGFRQIGIELPTDTTGVDGVSVVQNLVDPAGTPAIAGIQMSGAGGQFGAINDLTITGNTIRNFSAAGTVAIEFGSGSLPKGIAIRDNVLTSQSDSGTYSAIYFNCPATDISVSGNKIHGTSSDFRGITFLHGSVENVNIADNTSTIVASNSLFFITFGSDSVANLCMVNGNVVTSASPTFRGVHCNAPITRLTMSGNAVDGTTSGNACGLEFFKSVNEVSISSNQFRNLSIAAVKLSTAIAASLDDISLSSNTYLDCAATLLDATSDGAVVGSNIVTESGALR